MDVIYKPAVRKQLDGLPKADARRIEAAIQQVADTHPQRMAFVTEMVGQPGYWRLRKGDWRAIYRVAGEVLEVTDVAKRGRIYR